MESVGPVMRVVTEERPLTLEMWCWVLRGMVNGGSGGTKVWELWKCYFEMEMARWATDI